LIRLDRQAATADQIQFISPATAACHRTWCSSHPSPNTKGIGSVFDNDRSRAVIVVIKHLNDSADLAG
jgi:hypothetical protein